MLANYIYVTHMVEELSDICRIRLIKEAGNPTDICEILVQEIEHRMEDLTELQERLSGYLDGTKRTRRAPVEIIGTLANALFGIMSREDAEHYDQQIEQLKSDSGRNINVVTRQASILENTIDIFNETTSELTQRLEKLKGAFTTYLDINPKTRQNQREWTTRLNTLATITSLAISRYEASTLRILRLLEDLTKGNPFVTKEQLRKDLENINKVLNKDETLPINLQMDNIQSIII